MRPIERRAITGLSLIEIMVALLIGTILVLGLVQVFAASRTAYQLSEGLSRVQENARFAMDYIQRDLRMAGHYGCVNDQSHMQVNGALTSHFGAAASATQGINFPVSVRGYDATGTGPDTTLTLASATAGHTPALPTAISDIPNLARGSDIIELRFLSNEGVPVEAITHPTGTSTRFRVPAGRWQPLQDGVPNPTMFGIADCSFANVFPASNVNAAAGEVTTNFLITRYTPQPAGQTMLYRAESLIYYVALNGSNRPSLYRARSNNNGQYLDREELVEGIENLQFLYGLDREGDLAASPPSGYIDDHQPASTVSPNTAVEWRRTGLVQVGMLAVSPGVASAQQATGDQRPRALGVQYTTPNDARLRTSYEATVALRNRLYGN